LRSCIIAWDVGTVVVVGVLERLLHAGEALVEHLPTEQVLDLLVLLAGRGARPVVPGQFGHGGRWRRRQAVELQFGQGPVAVVDGHVPRELTALGEDRFVEELADLRERAVEVVLARQLTALLGDTAGEVVEAALVTPTAAEELPHRAFRGVPGHDVLSEALDAIGQVGGRRERVGTTGVLPVPGVP
jgi:hypothetical protein